jgi:hypothetical protein
MRTSPHFPTSSVLASLLAAQLLLGTTSLCNIAKAEICLTCSLPEGRLAASPAWSADASLLSFTVALKDSATAMYSHNIWIADPAGLHLTQLTQYPPLQMALIGDMAVGTGTEALFPTWTSTGYQLAFFKAFYAPNQPANGTLQLSLTTIQGPWPATISG